VEAVMGEDKRCACEEKHGRHLCVLRSRGMTGAIVRLTGNPNVACQRCGEEANSEESVCLPVPLFV